MRAEQDARWLRDLLSQDVFRMRVLKHVASLDLPDCFVAAGFVRNKVWDYLYGTTTALNDVDVVFYDADDPLHQRESFAEQCLIRLEPGIKWQVKNQAFMHSRNGDPEYANTVDAMGLWPEKETAIGLRLGKDDEIEICSAFGLQSLREGKLSHNPRRCKGIFQQRLKEKQWLHTWPELQLVI